MNAIPPAAAEPLKKQKAAPKGSLATQYAAHEHPSPEPVRAGLIYRTAGAILQYWLSSSDASKFRLMSAISRHNQSAILRFPENCRT
ncbi:hypothetical protein EV130_1299 [Rhizobium azibense]|uniref:Uncharacterized protein n=1 Tax=Rhizobium azibense TaxID=1136135 RepID=A0A4R3PYT0_9HYPH|nr:hypothetical protein [Rhizobium leguminosarum]MBB4358838.1 hypothetical protein [Rhizobium leguminosarum]MBB4553282.1 hypothetical protein [Rhizobium leguminosarum]MBB4565787.1 hypothetical protein [Rhizobium leguminosarum]TCU13858.1 hypothetical protein EV130_1299 [Rhizobium azibense]